MPQPTLLAPDGGARNNQKDRRGQRHAPERGAHDRADAVQVAELSYQHLALELEPEQKEEHRHEALGNPIMQWHAQGIGADTDAELRVDNVEIHLLPRRIG